jgi:ubiquinone/menaquinone biosynthesis C-methylase UbiE
MYVIGVARVNVYLIVYPTLGQTSRRGQIHMEKFAELSYKLHKNALVKTTEEDVRIQDSWLTEGTIDYWRHQRMIEPLKSLFKHYRNSNCVTIGDGRFGLDSIRLRELEPSLHILPTDISPHLLQKAKDRKIIGDFGVENAEDLSFSSEKFDFAICIEAYHHFPQPCLALYEMLRISRTGVVLVEPNDPIPGQIPRRILDSIRKGVHMTSRHPVHPEHTHFEESGNYVFTVSKREIEKVAMGLQLPAVAFHYFNDYYEKGVEFETRTDYSRLYRRVRRKIRLQDLKCRMGLSNYGHIIAILFKVNPPEIVKDTMRERGFTVIDLPSNPYLCHHRAGQADSMESATPGSGARGQ